jgi:putative transposase
MRTIKEEEVDLSEYEDYHHAYRQIGQFLEDVYMRKRVHSSLNYLSPAEFEIDYLSSGKFPVKIKIWVNRMPY